MVTLKSTTKIIMKLFFIKTFNSSFWKFAYKGSRDSWNRKQDQHVTTGWHRHNNVADTRKSTWSSFDVDLRAKFKSSPSICFSLLLAERV